VIVDSSAVVAVLLRQAGHEAVLDRLETGSVAGIGAPTVVETGIVLAARLGIVGKTLLARFLDEADLTILPFTAEHWPVAVDAYIRYGKGRHPAALNFGDCLTYAICRQADQPLLCLGDDFSRTDLELVG
jgi:ribonuclease VapC